MSQRDDLHILDPHLHRGHEGRIVITHGNRIVHAPGPDGLLWHFQVMEWVNAPLSQLHFLGHYNGQQVFCLELAPDDYAPLSAEVSELRDFLGGLPEGMFRLLGRAVQINNWYRGHRYCGYCGGATEAVRNERAMGCSHCGTIFYPRLSPCIMALVQRGEEVLLARNAAWPENRFSVLAGFIEPGEGAEDAVRREVQEEVSLSVKNLSYFNSQPWPFPGQLMLGFFAEYDSGSIAVDGEEIAEAHWYHYSQLPQIPGEYSLSGQLIRAFIARCEGGSC